MLYLSTHRDSLYYTYLLTETHYTIPIYSQRLIILYLSTLRSGLSKLFGSRKEKTSSNSSSSSPSPAPQDKQKELEEKQEMKTTPQEKKEKPISEIEADEVNSTCQVFSYVPYTCTCIS